ncbi:hypothetical protein L6452_33032 [Arctium lappa]|uniref:Uncharacterized protein n=1 Tax=Arctium lappa TaxID=4217 RepID=A0ACB8Z673_ARCLA|nr:hypothetical protein L6452_33032 [Arctium lappa]
MESNLRKAQELDTHQILASVIAADSAQVVFSAENEHLYVCISVYTRVEKNSTLVSLCPHPIFQSYKIKNQSTAITLSICSNSKDRIQFLLL